MALPKTPNDLRDLIPKWGWSLCEKFMGIFRWIEALLTNYRWMFTDNGMIAGGFSSLLCQLPCLNYTPEDCPEVVFQNEIVPANQKVYLKITGMNVGSGWTYKLYRSQTRGQFNETDIISTGTTGGPVFNYTDTGLTNGQTYFYKFTVQKESCNEYSTEINDVTPTPCLPSNATLVVAVLATGPFTIFKFNPPANMPLVEGASYTLYLITNSGELLIKSDVVNATDVQNGYVLINATEIAQNPPAGVLGSYFDAYFAWRIKYVYDATCAPLVGNFQADVRATGGGQPCQGSIILDVRPATSTIYAKSTYDCPQYKNEIQTIVSQGTVDVYVELCPDTVAVVRAGWGLNTIIRYDAPIGPISGGQLIDAGSVPDSQMRKLVFRINKTTTEVTRFENLANLGFVEAKVFYQNFQIRSDRDYVFVQQVEYQSMNCS